MKNRRLDAIMIWGFVLMVVGPCAYTLWTGGMLAPVFAPVDDQRMAEWILFGPDDTSAAIELDEAMTMTPAELDGALYAYSQFFAIAHDSWAASESSSVWSRVALTGLPEDQGSEAQLDRFPTLRVRMQRTPRWLVQLEAPDDRFVGGGVLADPLGGRLVMAHRSVVKDGYGGLALNLGDPQDCNLEVAMQFDSIEYPSSKGLDHYTLALAGQMRDGQIIIDSASSPVTSIERLGQLVDAGIAIDEYRLQFTSKRLSLANPEEAATVVRLAARLMIEATQEDSDVICGPWGHDDLASVAAFVRFGSWIPTPDASEL